MEAIEGIRRNWLRSWPKPTASFNCSDQFSSAGRRTTSVANDYRYELPVTVLRLMSSSSHALNRSPARIWVQLKLEVT